MDSDSCVIDLIEIVPLDNDRNCCELCHDIKLSPYHVKVCMYYILYLCTIIWFDCSLFSSLPPALSKVHAVVLTSCPIKGRQHTHGDISVRS